MITQPMTPSGRKRGTARAINMKIVASIQYTPTAYPDHPHAADSRRSKIGTWFAATRFAASVIESLPENGYGLTT
jgi:hypothetical protein